MSRAAVALALLVAGCRARAPVASCADRLDGEWRADGSGAWAITDDGARAEAYPLWPDLGAGLGSGVRAAPRAATIEHAAGAARLEGSIARLYTRGAHVCRATAPLHVLACADDTLDVILADPSEPAFGSGDACAIPRAGASRRERWHRVR